jgi:hypothetical protein
VARGAKNRGAEAIVEQRARETPPDEPAYQKFRTADGLALHIGQFSARKRGRERLRMVLLEHV